MRVGENVGEPTAEDQELAQMRQQGDDLHPLCMQPAMETLRACYMEDPSTSSFLYAWAEKGTTRNWRSKTETAVQDTTPPAPFVSGDCLNVSQATQSEVSCACSQVSVTAFLPSRVVATLVPTGAGVVACSQAPAHRRETSADAGALICFGFLRRGETLSKKGPVLKGLFVAYPKFVRSEFHHV